LKLINTTFKSVNKEYLASGLILLLQIRPSVVLGWARERIEDSPYKAAEDRSTGSFQPSPFD
jgi:hypothetical protein